VTDRLTAEASTGATDRPTAAGSTGVTDRRIRKESARGTNRPARAISAAWWWRELWAPVAPAERRAMREHLAAAVWGGLSAGLVSMTDVILAKTLHAPGWQVTLLATLGPAANLTSFLWAGAMEGRRKAQFFVAAGLAGRLPMLALLLAPSAGWLIGLSLLYAIFTALLATAINAVLHACYAAPSRARLFGLAASASALSVIVSVQGAGVWLEHDETAFPWIFALAAVTGLFSCLHLVRMERLTIVRRSPVARRGLGARPGRLRAMIDRLRIAESVLRESPDFARFERSFMIYGFAFLSLLPVLPLYVVRDLQMSYAQLSSTKGIWSQAGLVLLSPILGVVLGRLRPLLFTGRTFLLLAGYPICLLVSTLPGVGARVTWVYVAFLIFSVAMTGVNLSWTLGSMHFARGRDASLYQGVHVALTGVRGLLAPSLGYLVYRLSGARAAFALSAVLFGIAGIMMLQQDRSERAAGQSPHRTASEAR
jgi:hypothetical protein